MTIYPDSSFLARYFLEPESLPEQMAVLKRQNRKLPVFWLHRFEVVNAFFLYAFSSAAGSGTRVSREWAEVSRSLFLDALDSGQSALTEVSLAPSVLWRKFDELSLRYTARRGYRTYDLMHVSAALLWQCDGFWSFDGKANDLAKREGLKVL